MTIGSRAVGVGFAVLMVSGFAQASRDQPGPTLHTNEPAGLRPEAAAPGYAPSSTFQEVMDSVVDPAADYVWESVSYHADLKGVTDRRPRTDADWHALRQHAVVLVEAANLISVPGRKVANSNRMVEGGGPLETEAIQKRLDTQHAALVGFAGNLRGIGAQLIAAADRHDVEAITELGGTLDEVCESCHRAFWYPDEPAPARGRATDAVPLRGAGKK